MKNGISATSGTVSTVACSVAFADLQLSHVRQISSKMGSAWKISAGGTFRRGLSSRA